MSDSTKELKITVTTAADLSALKQTADALQGVRDGVVKTAASATLLRDAAKDLGGQFTPAAVTDAPFDVLSRPGAFSQQPPDGVETAPSAADSADAAFASIRALLEEIVSRQLEQSIASRKTTDSSDASSFLPGDSVQTLAEAIQLALKLNAAGTFGSAENSFQNSGTTSRNLDPLNTEGLFNAVANKKDMLNSFMGRLLNLIEKLPDFKQYESRLNALEQKFSNLPSPSSTPIASP
jgi:hypothetical protein